jgi:Tol biopolymer transport system component
MSLGAREDILALRPDGTGIRRLTDDGYRNRGPDFSPDSRTIAFFSNRTGNWEVWAIGVDGGGLTRVTRSTPPEGLLMPIWSPDGKMIAASRSSAGFVLLAWPHTLSDPIGEPAPQPGEGLDFQPKSWSPDSKQLAGHIFHLDGSLSGVALYDVEGRTYRRVTETGSFPVFLHDGRRIAYAQGTSIRVVDTKTLQGHEVVKGDARRSPSGFAISPDDRQLFVLWTVTQGDLWLMDLRQASPG